MTKRVIAFHGAPAPKKTIPLHVPPPPPGAPAPKKMVPLHVPPSPQKVTPPMAKKQIDLHLANVQPPAKRVIPLSLGHVTSAASNAVSTVSNALSNAAVQEQAASASPSVDVPGEIFHLGDGSAKQPPSLDETASRAEAGIAGMSPGEKVGIVAAVVLGVAGVYKWLTTKR